MLSLSKGPVYQHVCTSQGHALVLEQTNLYYHNFAQIIIVALRMCCAFLTLQRRRARKGFHWILQQLDG